MLLPMCGQSKPFLRRKLLEVVQCASRPALLYLFGDSLNSFGTVDPASDINDLNSTAVLNPNLLFRMYQFMTLCQIMTNEEFPGQD